MRFDGIHHARIGGLIGMAVWIAIVAFVVPSNVCADEVTTKYFRGLRERGLFSVAEGYCLHRLSQRKLTPAQRADLTLELAATLAEHAGYVGENQQTELWSRARSALDEFLKSDPDNPRRILLETEAALVSAAEGQWCRWQAELMPYDTTYGEQARRVLEDALSRLRELERKVAELARKGVPPRDVERGGLRPVELRSLLFNVRHRLGTALVDLAHVLPGDAPDRAAALLEADKLLSSLSDGAEGEEIAWSSRLMLLQCHRLLGDPARALREIESLEKQKPSLDMLDRLTAERIRVLLAQKKSRDAMQAFDDRTQSGRPLSGELAFAGTQALGELWRGANARNATAESRQLETLLQQRVEQAEREVGGYWAYRCVLVVEQIRDLQQYGAELAPLVRRAESDYARGRQAAAVASYQRAFAAAQRSGRSELAFHLGFTGASITLQARQWTETAAGFQELVQQFPMQPKAADAHLLAAFALGKLYDQQQTKSRRLEYTAALEAHRQNYAGHPSAAEATWMLAQLEERRQQITTALNLYRQIPPEHARGPAAQAAEARCYEKVLDRLHELKEPADAWEKEAIGRLGRFLSSQVDAGAAFDPPQCEIGVRLARILLHRRPPDFATADGVLDRVFAAMEKTTGPSPMATGDEIRAAESARAALKAEAAQLRIISLAGQGRPQAARELLNQLSTAAPDQLLRILEGLAPLTATAAQDPRRDLAELQLQAAQKLNEQRPKLQPAEQRRLDECLARAYAATGQQARALEVFEALITATPRDMPLLTAYAELLMQCGTRECLLKARTTWRKLETLHPAGSDPWLAVRFQHCQSLFDLQETAECRKLLAVTRLLYPKLGGAALLEKFTTLESHCRSVK